ncbi:MAG TPA: helix-turn-helix domain-containing protein [Candidatus Limnocylindrales bacterium]
MADMAILGVTGTEEVLYGRLVDAPPSTVADLAQDLAICQAIHVSGALPAGVCRANCEILGERGAVERELAEVLERLVAKGLVTKQPGEPARFCAVAPDLALEVLLREREQRLREARARIDELATAYRAHTGAPTATLIEVVTGEAAVRQRIAQLHRAARHELRILEKGPLPLPLLGKVVVRAVCENIDNQEGVRVLPAVPIRLYLTDDRLALLPLGTGPDPPDSAVILHPCGLFDALAALFEALWARALPAFGSPEESSADEDNRQRLVALLLSGLTDDAIARQLGVGHRTVQRQLAALMRELGATTRFQAGAQAARRVLGH